MLAPDAKPGDPVTTVNVTTADGFRYEIKAGPPQAENDPVLIRVTADLPKERTPGKGENPADKARLDAEFITKRKQLEDRLAQEKAFEGRPYLIAKSTVDTLVKDRAALLSPKPESPAPPATPIPVPPVTPPISETVVPAESPAVVTPPASPVPTAFPAAVLPTPTAVQSPGVAAPPTTLVPSPIPALPAEVPVPSASPFPTPADVPTAAPPTPNPVSTPIP